MKLQEYNYAIEYVRGSRQESSEKINEQNEDQSNFHYKKHCFLRNCSRQALQHRTQNIYKIIMNLVGILLYSTQIHLIQRLHSTLIEEIGGIKWTVHSRQI